MSKKMKNIAQSEVLTLREQISYQEGQVVSKTLTQNQAVSITPVSYTHLDVYKRQLKANAGRFQ